MSKGMLAILLAILAVLVASGMLVSAADAAVPGDWMYGVDRAMEVLRLRLAPDSKQKAQVERLLAQERLREAQALARRGENENAEQLRREARLARLAAKSTDPHYARKTEKSPVAPPPQVEQNELPLEQTGKAKADPYCNGTATRRHPAGAKLALRLSVDFSEVMVWYCQGYGFGEIGLAYRISRAAGVMVDQVFAQRIDGLSWEVIIQKYGLNGKLDKEKLKSSSG